MGCACVIMDGLAMTAILRNVITVSISVAAMLSVNASVTADIADWNVDMEAVFANRTTIVDLMVILLVVNALMGSVPALKDTHVRSVNPRVTRPVFKPVVVQNAALIVSADMEFVRMLSASVLTASHARIVLKKDPSVPRHTLLQLQLQREDHLGQSRARTLQIQLS